MKKIFSVLLSVVMTFCLFLPVLAGCDEKKADSPMPESLKLSDMKTEFAFGEEFSSEGLKVTVVYSDKTEKPSTDFTVDSSEYKKDTAGSYFISVSCEGLKKSYTVKVAAAPIKELVSLELSGMKTEFEYMEAFSSAGLIVTAVYEDGAKGTLSLKEYEIDFHEYDCETPGKYDILVICGDKIASYQVTVKEETHWWNTEMKLLMIGNSSSADAIEYMYQIAKAKGVKMTLGNLYISGCTVDTHYKNATGDRPAYDYYTNRSGVWKMTPGTRMRMAIEEEEWDYISFQQDRLGSSDPNTLTNLDELVKYVRELAPNAKFVWHLLWANAADTVFDPYYGGTQMGQYQAFVKTAQETVMPLGFEKILPSGTAIQNARTSFIGPAGTALNRDGYHLSFGLGRYIAGLTLFMTLTNVSVEKIDYAPEGVSDKEKLVAIESAVNAVQNPWEITPSQYR